MSGPVVTPPVVVQTKTSTPHASPAPPASLIATSRALADVASASPSSPPPSRRPSQTSPFARKNSLPFQTPPESTTEAPVRLVRKNVSPGLLARMKFLNQSQDTKNTPAHDIGRISEDEIRKLDEFHKDRSIRVQRRGSAWTGPGTGPPSQASTPLIPQTTGESVPMLAMDHSPQSAWQSNRSSFISTSDRVLPSDSEAGDAAHQDTQKYRLPDITKTKTLSQAIAETGGASGSSSAETEQPERAETETEQARAPTPPPKDTPPEQPEPPAQPAQEASVLDDNDGIDVAAYFHRRQFSRANSIYTLSRASFTNQIQQLTSITLPPAASLSSSISAIPTSTAAGRALHEAANQIKLWMAKATEVLSGLDAEDDVEWAAAAGREGLAEVDAAIGKFEELVTVYITAIEDLQSRSDIASLPPKDLTRLVVQMEEVVNGWTKIKQTLKGIKAQVELAMEWEELWNVVLGEIGREIEQLTRLVFEMEERRHRAISDSVAESAEKFDIAELETIVEETPRQTRAQSNRFSLPPAPAVMSPISPIPQIEKENSRLLALFAKLQPLRASLDFLPMRLSSYHLRASKVFPSACDELMRRKEQLEKQEKKLEADADALREELGEDKWVHSFRQAGSKAVAMYDSLMKSIQRLRQAMEENDEDKVGSRISTYKDKREHYPPSMRRVLELIDIEMKNRSTVNGEILRIQQDVRQKVSDLERETTDMDTVLEEYTSTRKLRDSVSTVLSARTEHSLTTSALDTPNSSPASSVILMGRRSSEYGRATPSGSKSRQPSTSSSRSSLPAGRRYSSLPVSSMNTNMTPRKSLAPTYSSSAYSSSAIPSRAMSSTPTSSVRSTSSTSTTKPRWNSSTNMRDTIVGHNFKPLSLTTPSPHAKHPPATPRSLRSVSSQSAIPVRSPLSQASTVSPTSAAAAYAGGRPASTTPAQQHYALPRRPGPGTLQAAAAGNPPGTPGRGGKTPGSGSRLSVTTTTTTTTTATTPGSQTRSSVSVSEEDHSPLEEVEVESPSARRAARPASAMMTSTRRSSMLPTSTSTAKTRTVSGSGSGLAGLTGAGKTGKSGSGSGNGRASPMATAAAVAATASATARSGSRLGGIDEGGGARSRSSAGRSSLDVGRLSRVGGRRSAMGGVAGVLEEKGKGKAGWR